MAIGKNLIEGVSLYQKEVDEKLQYYNIINDIYLKEKKIIEDKQNILKKVEEREKKFVRLFGNDMTKDKLKEHFYQLHIDYQGLSKLNGAELKKIVNKYKALSNEETGKDNAKFLEWLQSQEFQDVYEKFGKNMEKTILHFVREPLEDLIDTSHKGLITSHKTLRDKDLNNVLLADLGRVTQERIKKIIGASNTRHYTQKIKEPDVIENIFDGSIDWYGLTEGKKASDVKRDPVWANRMFKSELIRYIGDVTGTQIPQLSKIIDYVILKDSTAIFVGDNDKAITGLLGEIQALCYLSLLLKDKFSLSNPQQLNWVAKNRDNGKQFHADITLRDLGIQVKNTTDNQVSKVYFHESNLLNFLKYTQGYLSTNEIQIILNLYITYYFNVSYIPGDIPVEEGTNSDYEPTLNRLQQLITIADKLLNLLGFAFMYIGIGDSLKNFSGNVAFFLGGEDLIFASEIIQSILDDIEKEAKSFNIERPNHSSYTIVNFINDNPTHWREKEGKKYLNPKAQRVSAFIADNVLDDIKMKSSYDFTEIINKQLYRK